MLSGPQSVFRQTGLSNSWPYFSLHRLVEHALPRHVPSLVSQLVPLPPKPSFSPAGVTGSSPSDWSIPRSALQSFHGAGGGSAVGAGGCVHIVGGGPAHVPAPAPQGDVGGGLPLYHGLGGAAGGGGSCLRVGALPCPFLLALLLGEGDDTPWGRAAVPKTHPSWSRLLLDGVRFASPFPPNSLTFSCAGSGSLEMLRLSLRQKTWHGMHMVMKNVTKNLKFKKNEFINISEANFER